MGDLELTESIADRYERIRPWLNERQRRVWLGNEALALGYGGIKAVAAATGVHPDTVAKGRAEVDSGDEPDERVRRAGADRKGAAEHDPGLEEALLKLVSPATRGDPESVLVWTSASTVNLAKYYSRGFSARGRAAAQRYGLSAWCGYIALPPSWPQLVTRFRLRHRAGRCSGASGRWLGAVAAGRTSAARRRAGRG